MLLVHRDIVAFPFAIDADQNISEELSPYCSKMFLTIAVLLRTLRAFLSVTTWSLLIWIILRCLESLICRVTDEEPPVVRSRVPFLGNALRLFRHGVTYYEILRKQTRLPILTTFLGTQKVYVVNSPDLIAQINRQGKKLDANLPFLFVVCGKLFGMHGEDLAGLMRDASSKDSLRHDLKIMEHASLEAGTEPMMKLHGLIAEELAGALNRLASQGPTTLSLKDWLQTTFALATARAFFGRGNPLDQSADLVDSLWIMESGLKPLTMLPFPSVTARKAVAARDRLVLAFIDDFGCKDSLTRASVDMNRKICEISERHNMSVEFRARYAIGFLAGFVINTVPAAFWMIGLLAANADLADRIRSEVKEAVTVTGSDELALEATSLRAQCPLLVSTCREILRYISSSISNFIVQDDVHLDDGRVLKQGALIQIAATAIHSNPAVWGQHAAELDPERFLKREKIHPSANRVFGGGSSLCPGRHLALDELLTFSAMFAHTFEVNFSPETPCLPGPELNNMLSVKKPSSELHIQVDRRDHSCWKRWKYPTAV